MRVVLMGPPGAGKGTQADVVSELLGVPHISTGEIFRGHVATGSPLGIEAGRYMDAGEYVPDGVTNAMVRDRLSREDCRGGFLLDGYPRTLEQVGELSAMLSASGTPLDAVIELTVDLDVVVDRMVRRAIEQGRKDDTEDVIRRRLEVYFAQTAPLTAVYQANGQLRRIDGEGSIEDVTGRILSVLGVES
jgi:adenylate kinase